VRMDIKRFHQNMKMMGSSGSEYSEGSDEKDSKASDFSEPSENLPTSEEKCSNNNNMGDRKRKKMLDEEDNKEDKRWRGDLLDKTNVNCRKFPKLSLHMGESEVKWSNLKEPFESKCIKNPLRMDTDDVKKTPHKSDITKSPHLKNEVKNDKLYTDFDTDHITSIDSPDEDSERNEVNPEVDLTVNDANSSMKLENVLVFLDFQKLQNSVEDPFSQIGCFFNESSFNRDISETTEQIQSFYAVTTPKLEDLDKNPELWSKYVLFDEFYYKHPHQMIRCVPEKTALENLCQYLAKIKLKYRDVNICVLTRRKIEDLMKRISTYNMGNIFFSNVDGFTLLDDALITEEMDLSSVPEHSDIRSESLYNTSFEHFCKNYYDIHTFPFPFKGLKDKSFESEEVKSKALYIGDLSMKVTDQDLEKKISRVARPLSVKVCVHPKTGMSLGYAYANFHCEEKAEKVLTELQASPLMNKPMRIMYYNKRVVDKNNHLWKSNVFVKNLVPHVNNKRLEAAFSAYGQILSCKVATDERGASKCFGFVQFKTENSAWKAINDLNGLRIDSKELYVSIKKSVRDRIEEEKKKLVKGKGLNYTVLEIRNLDPETTHESFFSLMGKVSANVTRFHLEKREDEGTIGFVTFKSSTFASEAQNTLDKMEVGGFKLIVLKHERQKLRYWKLAVLKEKERMKEGVERDKEIFNKYGKNGFKETHHMKDLREKLKKY